MPPYSHGTRDDTLAATVQASVGSQFSLATIRAIIDAADRARAGDPLFGDHKQPPRRDQADHWPDGRREHWDAES